MGELNFVPAYFGLFVGLVLFCVFLHELLTKRSLLGLGGSLFGLLWLGLMGQYCLRMYQETHFLAELQPSQVKAIVVEKLSAKPATPLLRVTEPKQIAIICKSLNGANSYMNNHGGFDTNLLLRLELQDGKQWGCCLGQLHKQPWGVVLTLKSENGRGPWMAGYLQSNQLKSDLVEAGLEFSAESK